MRGKREENIMKHSKLSNFHGFWAFQFLITIQKKQAISTIIGKQPKGSKYIRRLKIQVYIYIIILPIIKHPVIPIK